MKHWDIAQFLVVTAFVALSFSPQSGAAYTEDEKNHFCGSIEEIAKATMTHKQIGTSMVELMKMMPTDPEQVKRAVAIITKAAYAEPDYSTEAMKKKQVIEFGNRFALACYTGLDGDRSSEFFEAFRD